MENTSNKIWNTIATVIIVVAIIGAFILVLLNNPAKTKINIDPVPVANVEPIPVYPCTDDCKG